MSPDDLFEFDVTDEEEVPPEVQMLSSMQSCDAAGALFETIPDFELEGENVSMDDGGVNDLSLEDVLGVLDSPEQITVHEDAKVEEPQPPARKRGRKTGSVASKIAKQAVAEAKAAAQSLSLALSDIRRNAAKTRWQKHKEDALSRVPVQAPDAASVPSHNDQAFMPFSGCHSHLPIVEQIMKLTAPKDNDPPKLEKKLWCVIHQSASFQNVAERLHSNRKTVSSRLRMMALMVIVYKRFRAAHVMTIIDDWLHSKYPGCVRRLEWLCKFKYDEMSLLMTLPRPGAVIGGEKHLTKLLQVTACWSALWLVHDTPVVVDVKVPTQLKPIARNTAKCNFHGLVPQLQCPRVADQFEKKSLLAIADDHAANQLAESIIWSLAGGGDGSVSLERFRCTAHKEDKVGKFGSAAMNLDMRGALHGCLSFQFAGLQSCFRKAMKRYLRRPGVFKYRPWGEGPSQRAQDHNKLVFDLFYNDSVRKKQGQQSKGRAVWLHCVRQIFKGRLRIHGVVEHWCKGCCSDADDCLRRIDSLVIDRMFFPAVWKSSTWNESLQALDFFGLWCSIHGILEPVYNLCMFSGDAVANPQGEATAMGAPHLGSDAPDPDQGADDDTDGEEDPGNEEGLEIIDPDKQESTIQRQSTYRTNCRRWLASKPLGRLMALRKISGVQQQSMAAWFKQSGKAFEVQELSRRLNGETPTHRLLLFLEGRYTTEAMASFGGLMRGGPCEWPLPPEFQTHVLALKIFQSTAASTASKLVLLKAKIDCFPYRGYKLLIARDDASRRWIAAQIVEDFVAKPCVFDGFWYEHVKAHPSPEALLSKVSISVVWHHCIHAELDNIDTETRNASIRRDAHRSSTQRKTLDVQDLDSMWVIRQEREDNAMIRDNSPDPSSNEDEEVINRRSGGRLRAFWSEMSKRPEFRLESNQPDFKKISKAWKTELSKDHSQLLEDCVEEGRKATRVGQAQRAAKRMRNDDQDGEMQSFMTMSAFGTVRPRDQAIVHARNRDKGLLQTLSLTDEPHAESAARLSEDLHQIIPAESLTTLAISSGKKIEEQVAAIKRILRLVGVKQADNLRKTQQLVKAGAKQQIKIGENVLDGINLPEDVTLRSVPSGCDIVAIKPVLNSKAFSVGRSHVACSKVGKLKEEAQAKLAETLEGVWKTHHGFEDEDTLPDLPQVHPSFKPTMCFTMGFGRCLCTGHGKVVGLARARFAKSICDFFPKNSPHRHWLTQGWLLVEVGAKFYHVSLCYLKPHRPTLIRMIVPETTFWGRRHAIPLFRGDEPDSILDVDLMFDLDLDGPLLLRLYKFVVFSKRYIDWTPVSRLTFEKLCDHMETMPEHVLWWDGKENDLARDHAKQVKKRAAEERARARAKAAPGPKAKAKAKAKVTLPPTTQRDSQRPLQPQQDDLHVGAGVQMLALPAPLFPIPEEDGENFDLEEVDKGNLTPSDLSEVDQIYDEAEDDQSYSMSYCPSDYDPESSDGDYEGGPAVQ